MLKESVDGGSGVEQIDFEQMKAEIQKEVEAHKSYLNKDLEHYKHTLAKSVEHYKENLLRTREHVRIINDFALASIRMAMIVNGGAIVALLAMIGNAMARQPDISQGVPLGRLLWPALSGFAVGLVLAVLSGMLSYLTILIWETLESGKVKVGVQIIRGGSIAAGGGSLLAFIIGSVLAIQALAG